MQDSAAASFHGMKPQQQFPEQEQHLKCPRCDSTNTKFCYYNNYNLSQPRHFCKNCKRYWTKGGALRNIPVGGSTRKNSKRSSSTTAGGGTSATNANATSTSNNGNPPKRPNSSTISNIPASPSPISSAATSAFGLQLPKPEHFAPMFPAAPAPEQERQMLDLGGSFSSLLAASGHFGGLLESFHPTGTGIFSLPNSGDHVGGTMAGSGIDLAGSENRGGNGENPHPEPEQGAAAENFMGLQGDSGCWNGSNGNRDGGGGGSGWPGLSMYTPGSTFRQ